jgi:uncharacterized membrane protein HdeD (DUF308 family)
MAWLMPSLPVGGPALGIILIVIGIIIWIFPRIINYLIGAALVISGIMWILSGSWLWGILSLVFGIIVFIFPRILNYIIGIYLIIVGIGQIVASGFALGWPLAVGAITLLFGIIVMVNPGVLNGLVAFAFIIQGVFLLARFFRWF